jgi:simple sugar transport system ATP-binding protein
VGDFGGGRDNPPAVLSPPSLPRRFIQKRPVVRFRAERIKSVVVANAGCPYALEMVNIEKSFGLVRALKDINLQVGRNEIVGLIGDNGAGKSTMVKILTGVHRPTSGELYVAGRMVDLGKYNVKTAHSYGIETVYQDKSLGEKQVLWRNFFIGRQIERRFGFIDVKKEKEVAHEIMLNTIGFRGKGITVDSKVNKLSGGERQGVAIGRAMHFEAEIIILDEPTVALSLKEVRKVLNFVHKIKEGGKACIYVSHNIQDVYEISDRFVVLDRGELVASIDKKDTSLHELDEFLLKYAHGLKDKSES